MTSNYRKSKLYLLVKGKDMLFEDWNCW